MKPHEVLAITPLTSNIATKLCAIIAKHASDEKTMYSRVSATGYAKLISFEDKTKCIKRKQST